MSEICYHLQTRKKKTGKIDWKLEVEIDLSKTATSKHYITIYIYIYIYIYKGYPKKDWWFAYQPEQSADQEKAKKYALAEIEISINYNT